MLFRTQADHRFFFSPLLALQGLEAELERLLERTDHGRSSALAFALYRRDDGLLLRTPLPGVDPAKITLEVDGDAVTLTGCFECEPESEHALAQHVERPRGSFTRTLHLDFEVDAARVTAKLEHGVLEVALPRLQKNPPVKIQVLPAAQNN